MSKELVEFAIFRKVVCYILNSIVSNLLSRKVENRDYLTLEKNDGANLISSEVSGPRV